MHLAKNIIFLRNRKRLTQTAFAEIIGVEQSTVANWENGDRTPNIETLVSISQKFNISLDDLVKADYLNIFPERLKSLRTSAGMTQDDIGRRLNVGKSTVCNWERGISEPDLGTLVSLALILDTSTDYLLGLSDERR